MEKQKTKNKVVIGIDQSYKRTGITVLCNKQIVKMFSVDFVGYKTNTEKRNKLKQEISKVIYEISTEDGIGVLNSDVSIITERIRLRSQQFLSENYIKATGALVATIIDVAQHLCGIPVYSVDTRSWKSQIVGNSKPLQNKHGINPEKYRTILYLKQKGLLKYIVQPYYGRGEKGIINVKIDGVLTPCKINDDIADSYCIAMYGFIPKSQQKLKQETF